MDADQGVLTTTCPRCGESFSSALWMDQETFAQVTFDLVLEMCPHCLVVSRFARQDYNYPSPDQPE
jgi:phage FluMu protein Com